MPNTGITSYYVNISHPSRKGRNVLPPPLRENRRSRSSCLPIIQRLSRRLILLGKNLNFFDHNDARPYFVDHHLRFRSNWVFEKWDPRNRQLRVRSMPGRLPLEGDILFEWQAVQNGLEMDWGNFVFDIDILLSASGFSHETPSSRWMQEASGICSAQESHAGHAEATLLS